ncbi:GGDEF domain-containing protein [Terrihabitans soli]|nr:GGDEF domain-containing protein [Terrihabitans soli]
MKHRGAWPLYPAGLKGRVLALVLMSLLAIAVPAAAAFFWIIDTTVVKIGTLFAEKQILFDRYRGLESLMREVSLAETAARSPAIIEWAREEDSSERAARGLAELEHYRTSFKDRSYFFAIRRSGNYYFNDANNAYAGAQKRYTLSEDNPRDGWFYNTINLESGCHLNVDHDDNLKVTKVWINCVVRDGRDVVGVLGTGVDLTQFIREVVDIPQTGVTSMFVDLNGAVQAHRDPRQVDFHSITKNLKSKKTIFGLVDNDADRATLRAMMNEVSAGKVLVRSDFMKVDGHTFLVGVGYLDRLGWFNVTLMDINEIIDWRLFRPIAFLLVAMLLATAALLAFLFKRSVLDRLARLEAGTRRVTEGDFNIPADARQDEIGSLSRAFTHMAAVVGEKTHVLEGMVKERTEKLERLAFLDPMTEIWNRRGFSDAFAKEQNRAQRSGRHIGVLIVDMDRFKSINDSYGHQTGDLAIIEVATRISGALRDYDICARWGGDEFIILASDVNKTSLALMAGKLIAAVNADPMMMPDGNPLDLSVSIGGTMVSEYDLLGDAVGKADAALYQAKRTGRNGYMIHDPKADIIGRKS